MTEFAQVEWDRAQRTLNSAQLLAETDPDSAVSRAYYAAFHAVTALFALRGVEFLKHTAVRAAVHRDLIKMGEWSPSLGRDFDFLLEMRDVGDYGGVTRVTSDDAADACACAQRLLAAVAESAPSLPG